MGLRLNFNACLGLALFAFVAIVQPSSALNCFICTTTTNGNTCADPFNATEHIRNMRTSNCEMTSSQSTYGYSGRHVCMKIVQKENGQRQVIRSCAVPNHDEIDNPNGPCSPHTATRSHVTIESCHICNTDYCNGASSISGMQLLQASAIALVTCALSPSVRSFF